MVAATVFFSLIGVVLFGTMTGSILPLVLRRVGFDPASASAPFVATLVERRLKSSGKRRHVPVAAMRFLPPLIRPFNEVTARLMTLGLYRATESAPFPGWKGPADRFGVTPRTVETHVEQMER